MPDALEREIRDLRSLYWSEDRDPEGRAFAPLADACRRAGDLDQALELIEDGLDRHPDFSPGHLVAAWVHWDRGDGVESESAFRRVLELDEENASALNGLGRLLAARGEEAGVEMVLRAQELDPTLRRRGRDVAPASAPRAPAHAEPAPPPAPTAPAEPEATSEVEEVVDLAALAPDPAEAGDDDEVVDLSALAPDEAEAGQDDEVVDFGALPPDEAVAEQDEEVVDFGALAPDAPGADAEETDDEVFDLAALVPDEPVAEDEDDVFDLAALAPDAPAEPEAEPDAEEDDDVFDLAALAPDAPAEAEAEPDAEDDDVFDLAALAPDAPAEPEAEPVAEEDDDVFDLAALAPDAAAEAEAEPVVEDEDVFDLAALAPEAPDDAPTPDEAPAPVAASEPRAAAPAPPPPPPEDDYYASDEEEAEANAPLDESELAGRVVTRTMAELLARQGMTSRALQMYEELVARSPDDEGLAARRDELREVVEREPAPTPAGTPTSARAAVVDPGSPDGRASHEEVADMLAPGQPHPSAETPFAWIGGDDEDDAGDASPSDGPPATEYLTGLLSWRRGDRAAASTPAPDVVPDDERSVETSTEAPADEPDPDGFFDAWGGGT